MDSKHQDKIMDSKHPPKRDWRAMREAAGFSLRELAGLTGYSYATISNVENGHDRPSKRLESTLFEMLDPSGKIGKWHHKKIDASYLKHLQTLITELDSFVTLSRRRAEYFPEEKPKIERRLKQMQSMTEMIRAFFQDYKTENALKPKLKNAASAKKSKAS